MNKTLLAASLVLALGSTGSYASSIISIDPDGSAGSEGPISVGSLDWATGNALATGTDGAAIPLTIGDTLQTYGHTRLNAFQDADGNAVGGLDLNSNYEWTYVFGFREDVVAGGTAAVFSTAAGGNNFFRVYFDAPDDSNQLAGQGFQDGQLILEGTILPGGISNFTQMPNQTGDLDQFGEDNYPNVDSVTGVGGGTFNVDVNFVDTSFFLGGLDTLQILLDFDTQQNLPFSQTNPSSCFWNGTAFIDGVGPNTNGGPCTTNTVGAINGESGPNIVLQTDASTNFNTTVPEPGSLALMGLGLAAWGGLKLRRRRSA